MRIARSTQGHLIRQITEDEYGILIHGLEEVALYYYYEKRIREKAARMLEQMKTEKHDSIVLSSSLEKDVLKNFVNHLRMTD